MQKLEHTDIPQCVKAAYAEDWEGGAEDSDPRWSLSFKFLK